jgi:hypothetical protein
MDRNAFDGLVDEVGHWWIRDVPDCIRLMDSDRLRDLSGVAEKRKWLCKAKKEALQRDLQGRIDDISEAWNSEDDCMVEVSLEAFSEDIKDYKGQLSSSQEKFWLNKAALAACGKANEIGTYSSVVYFVSPGDDLVKIGYTTNLKSRVRTLQTGHSKPLEILLVLDGNHDLEQELHKQFSKRLKRGEWFRLSGEISKFIKDNRFRIE